MTHECKLNCRTMDSKQAELLGVEDPGKWLPFIFHMDIVDAAKLTTDDETENMYGCTTIYAKNGEYYMIDTPYEKFFELFKAYSTTIIFEEDDTSDIEF